MCQLAVMSSGPLAYLKTHVYLWGKLLFFSDLLTKLAFHLFYCHKYFSDFSFYYLPYVVCIYMYVGIHRRHTDTHTYISTLEGCKNYEHFCLLFMLVLVLLAFMVLCFYFCFLN